MAFNWREHLAIHPAAELFPLMSEVELKELAEDIEKNGPRQNIVLCGDPRSGLDNCQLVDGRNRLDALAMLGFLGVNDGGGLVVTKQHTKDGKWIDGKGHQPFCYYLKGEAPYALALSYNVHRRHLTAAQKHDLIARLLKEKPELSDRQIGKMTKSDKNTVAADRAKLERRGEIHHVETRKDTKGRKQPAKKAKAITKPEPEQNEPEASAERMKAAHAAVADSEELERDRKECVALNHKVIEAERERDEASGDEMTPEERLEHFRAGLVIHAEQAADLAGLFAASLKECPTALTPEAIRGVYRVVDRWSALLKATAAAARP
jgi:hypothetical protein